MTQVIACTKKEEGDPCRDAKCDGVYYWSTINCSCHLRAPCHSCTDAPLECTKCGDSAEAEE